VGGEENSRVAESEIPSFGVHGARRGTVLHDDHEQGSDVGLVLPVSTRAAKSIIRLSQSLDKLVEDKGVDTETIKEGYLDSMLQSYKLVSAYSGVLNEAAVRNTYGGVTQRRRLPRIPSVHQARSL